METIDLLYLSFGGLRSYQQTLFSLFSFFAHHDTEKFRITVLTDNPTYFSTYVRHWPVRFHYLDADKIKEMRGPLDFVHRMKIASIEILVKEGAQKVLYIDSDTFFLSSIYPKAVQINRNFSLMHKHEFHFSKAMEDEQESKTRQLYLLLQKGGISGVLNNGTFVMKEHFSSWNAGVVGISSSHLPLLGLVYAFTDQIYAATGHHASEQFSFSYVLETNTSLHTCQKEVFHYWPKLQKDLAFAFFTHFFTEPFVSSTKESQIVTSRNASRKLYSLLTKDPRIVTDLAITAFYQKRYKDAYWYSFKAFAYGNRKWSFLKDIAYHTKRIMLA